MKIKKARISEAGQVRELFGKIFAESFSHYTEKEKERIFSIWKKEKIAKRIKNDDFALFVARDERELVGFILAKYVDKHRLSYVNWFGVLKQHQGKGIGKRLFGKWIEWAKDKGAIMLRVSTTRKENTDFYKSYGFSLKSTMKAKSGLTRYRLIREVGV
jgi:ribosomal protein S18 acetylase RimI-like enzyme